MYHRYHDKPINSVITFYYCPCAHARAKECEGLKVHSNTQTHTHMHRGTPVILSYSILPFKGSWSATAPEAQTQHLSSVYCQPLDVIGLELASGSLHRDRSSAVCHDVSLYVLT